MHLLAGNTFSLLAMVTDSFSASRKTPRGVLLAQTVSQLFYFTGTMILGGYSACVQNVVSILRNLAAIRGVKKKWIEWTLVGLGVVFGVWFNTLGVVGLLPVLANLEYTLAVFRFSDNERALKLAFLVNAILFAVFNAVIWNFVGVLSDTVVFISLIVYFIRNRKSKGSEEKAPCNDIFDEEEEKIDG